MILGEVTLSLMDFDSMRKEIATLTERNAKVACAIRKTHGKSVDEFIEIANKENE